MSNIHHEPWNREHLNRAIEKAKQNRKSIIWSSVVAVLCLIMLLEAVIIYQQKRVNEHIQALSAQALDRFVKEGQGSVGQTGAHMLLRNVRFCWSKQVCINTRQLTATAQPINGRQPILFDNLLSYLINVHNADVLITPKTLQGMFNESVFNYPNSKLRNLTVGIEQQGGSNHVLLNGSLNYILWIPFQMDTNLAVDQKTNTLLITVNTLKVFGFIPATWLIELKPFNLDKLLTLPENHFLTVHQNVMMVKPFGLFPPPRINGKMSEILVTPQFIQLKFSGKDPSFNALPQSAKNLIYVQGGPAQFGNIELRDTAVEVIDNHPQDLFQFSLLNYLDYLPRSDVRLLKDGGAVLKMPDITTLTNNQSRLPNPENSTESERMKYAPKAQSFFEKVKSTIKKWFAL